MTRNGAIIRSKVWPSSRFVTSPTAIWASGSRNGCLLQFPLTDIEHAGGMVEAMDIAARL